MSAQDNLSPKQFFHGTTAELTPGEHIEPGHESVWRDSSPDHVYFTTNRKAAASWAHKTAKYDLQGAPPRVYEVEPTGTYERDANKQGASYQSRSPLKILGEERAG